jgi:hypothetical protein
MMFRHSGIRFVVVVIVVVVVVVVVVVAVVVVVFNQSFGDLTVKHFFLIDILSGYVYSLYRNFIPYNYNSTIIIAFTCNVLAFGRCCSWTVESVTGVSSGNSLICLSPRVTSRRQLGHENLPPPLFSISLRMQLAQNACMFPHGTIRRVRDSQRTEHSAAIVNISFTALTDCSTEKQAFHVVAGRDASSMYLYC